MEQDFDWSRVQWTSYGPTPEETAIVEREIDAGLTGGWPLDVIEQRCINALWREGYTSAAERLCIFDGEMV